jgi:copper resistance protein D
MILGESRSQALDPGRRPRVIALVVVLFLFYFQPAAWSQERDTGDMKDMPGMQMDDHGAAAESPKQIATRIADKRESEFSHHLAGFLILLAGVFILAQSRLAARWPGVRFVWPSCFLLAGLFLLLFSDTEMWPVGPQTPWFAITHNAEDLQHKTFSAILLVLGYIELQRARGRFKSPWFAWFFPVLGVGGAILLLFHQHEASMSGPSHMAVMGHIQNQHRAFAATGAGIAVSKGLSDMNLASRWFFSKLFPLLMIALGLLLMLYAE